MHEKTGLCLNAYRNETNKFAKALSCDSKSNLQKWNFIKFRDVPNILATKV
jgi:hypothetical protein